MEQQGELKNQPEKKFTASPVTATIWLNEATVDGEVKKYRTIIVERSYKDKEDNWKSTTSFRTNDIPKVVLVLSEAYKFMALKDDKEQIISS